MNPKQDKKYQKQKRNKRTKKREKETERKKTKPRKRKKRIDSTKIWYVRLSRIYVFCRDFLTDLLVSEPAGMSVGLLQLMP